MGCVKLHILDEQYKSTELRVSYFNKELTLNNSAENPHRWILLRYIDPDGRDVILFNVTHRNGSGRPDGTRGQVSSTTNATLKISSYGRDKNEIGETVTHKTQLHGTSMGDQIEGKKEVPSESQDHKALKNKDTKHDGYNNYNSVKKQLETIDENYRKAFEDAQKQAQKNY